MRLYKIDFDTRHPGSGPRVYEKNAVLSDGAIRNASNGAFICEGHDVGVITQRGAVFTGFVTQRQQVDQMAAKILQKVRQHYDARINQLTAQRRAAEESAGLLQWDA